MYWRFAILVLVVSCGFLGRVPAGGQFPPNPRPVDLDDCKRFSSAEFEGLIRQLKTERNELDASRKTPSKWNPNDRTKADRTNADEEHLQLQMQLREVLERLKQRQQKPPP